MSMKKRFLAALMAMVLCSIPFANAAMAASEGSFEGVEAGSLLEKALKADNVTQKELNE